MADPRYTYTPIPGDESQADKLTRHLKNRDEKSISNDTKQLDKLLSTIRNNRKKFNSSHTYYFEHREKFLDPEYNSIVKAVKTYGATLAQVQSALHVENGMDHDQIKRLINDAKQKHPNIERLRKEFYLEKIKQETNKICSREQEPQAIAKLLDQYVLNAVNVGASLHELCSALRSYYKTTPQADYAPIDRLVTNQEHDNNPHVARIKMEIKETEIVLAAEKLLNLPKSSTKKLFDNNQGKIEEELLEHCKQFTEMGGNVIEALQKHSLELPAHTLAEFNKRQKEIPQANILNL